MVHLVTDSRRRPHAALDGHVRRWMRSAMSSQRDYLTQLDAPRSRCRPRHQHGSGFSAAVVDLDAVDGSTPGELLTRVGSTLVYASAARRALFGGCFRQVGVRSVPPRPSTPRPLRPRRLDAIKA
jgi:hypothetical protein